MIRFSTNNDINGIVSLWHEAFGDSEQEIKFFLERKFKPENTLLIEENGDIASMLFLLDGKMCINKIDYPAYYLYAACTAKKHRGKGLMASLLAFAKDVSQSRGVSFICLMPGEESLFEFYAKHGYRSVFSKKELTVSYDEIKNIKNNLEFESIDIEADFELIRNKAFGSYDFFKWDNPAISFAFDNNKLYGGYHIITREGYLLYSKVDDYMYVKEFAFPPQTLASVSALLLSKCRKIVFNLPANYQTAIGEYKIMSSAMLLPLDEESETLINNVKNAYIGLTLD